MCFCMFNSLQSSSISDEAEINHQNNNVQSEQHSILSEAGNMEMIINLVSNFWDSSIAGTGDVPFLRPSNDDVPKPTPPPSTVHVPRATYAPREPAPNTVRMITISDALPHPNLPVPPPPQLPDMSAPPLAAASSANGCALDLEWLETFDNATLESIVPRDPYTARPLTVGSLSHGEGKCRPCIFFLRAKCFKGLRCSFCHFNHQGLRRPVLTEESFDLNPLLFPSESSSGASSVAKSKRLRPSKRTREMIKQINEQMLFGDIQEDPNGPALSITPISE